eukprot:TRINITY_DN12177_c0_g1_i1.p1 TRINITY_DN12177_c0_g1~~TRINITY_DN12177_c0_g1_i1.p1  ORF type:complete len:186 (+),score=35.14 TRINITY_DN12177_c0_g1_i1:64-621(+)
MLAEVGLAVQRSIDGMGHLREEECKHYAEAEGKVASKGTSCLVKEGSKTSKQEGHMLRPKQQARKVTFQLEHVDIYVYSERVAEVNVPANSCEEDAWHSPRRSPGFRLGVVDKQNNHAMRNPQAARGTSESAEEILKKSQAFQPIVPVEGEQAPRTLSARFGAAMKEIRLRASRRSQRVCPDPSD